MRLPRNQLFVGFGVYGKIIGYWFKFRQRVFAFKLVVALIGVNHLRKI